MWTPAAVIGVISGLSGLLGAVTVLVRQLRHEADPNAHAAALARASQGSTAPGQGAAGEAGSGQ